MDGLALLSYLKDSNKDNPIYFQEVNGDIWVSDRIIMAKFPTVMRNKFPFTVDTSARYLEKMGWKRGESATGFTPAIDLAKWLARYSSWTAKARYYPSPMLCQDRDDELCRVWERERYPADTTTPVGILLAEKRTLPLARTMGDMAVEYMVYLIDNSLLAFVPRGTYSAVYYLPMMRVTLLDPKYKEKLGLSA